MDRDDLFKLTEKTLFRYSDTLKKLVELKNAIKLLRRKGDVKTQCYGLNFETPSGARDPVAEYVCRLMTLETKITKLERDIAPIKKFISDMEKEKSPASKGLLLFMRLFYDDKHSIKEIASGLGVPRRTLYARRRQIVKKCAKYFEG